jgi:teichuronic acid biosynthesis glycosyltransferase TuaH
VVGQLNDRLDADLLAAVADTGMGLLLVGPRDSDRWDDLIRRPNVHHVGAVPHPDLPRWLARMDVGLTPYTDSAFNRASFPLKTLEYLAAGRPVVGSDLPATRGLAQESVDVSAVAGPADFAARVRAVADIPSTSGAARRRRSVAGRHAGAARATRLAQLVDLATGVHLANVTDLAATNGTAQSMHTAVSRKGQTTPRSTG